MDSQSNPPSKVGRKSKYNPYTVAKIIKNLKNGNNMVDSAQLSGISKATLFEWINTKPEFSDKVQEAISHSKQLLIKNIITAGKRGQWQASSWLLERRYPQEYALKTITELQGRVDSSINIKVLPDIPRELTATQASRIQEALTAQLVEVKNIEGLDKVEGKGKDNPAGKAIGSRDTPAPSNKEASKAPEGNKPGKSPLNGNMEGLSLKHRELDSVTPTLASDSIDNHEA